MTDLDLTTDATVPANTSLTVTVYEDVGDDGSGANTDPNGKAYDNSASQSIDDGTNTYTLTGFDGSSGNALWIEVTLSTSDTTATASLNSATVTLAGQTIAASTSSLTTQAPSVSVSSTGLDVIRPGVETTTTSEPGVSVDQAIGASVATLTVAEPSVRLAIGRTITLSANSLSTAEPALSMTAAIGVTAASLTVGEPSPRVAVASPQTLTAAPATLSAVGPTINTLTDTGSVGGGAVGSPVRTPDLMGVEATHDTLSLTWRSRVYSDEISSLRAFRTHAGEVSRVLDSEGGWEAFDTALDEDNTFSVAPPSAVVPPLEAGEYLVRSYRESEISADGRVIDIDVEFVRPSPRDAEGSTLSETQGTGDWLFEFSNGTIATPHVTRSGQGGQDTVEFELVVDADQAEVVLESATRLEAVAVEAVPDGDDFVRDNNAASRNTVTITQPSSIDSDYLPDSGGQFVVQDWRLRDRDDSPQRWRVELTVRLL